MFLKNIITSIFGDPHEKERRRLQPIIDEINALESEVQGWDREDFPAKTRAFKKDLEGLSEEEAQKKLEELLPLAYAMVREASVRTIGLRHYDVQLFGGIILHQGKIAEMKTGEGKTLVATLPLYLNSLLGRGVHLVTPNDYLSKYGVQWMGPIYDYLGVSVGVIQASAANPDMSSFLFDPESPSDDERFQNLKQVSRREAYDADITYGTNNEFGFDYLRDNMARTVEDRVQRELWYAIVDEVDNILIDEARTPLIISGQGEEPPKWYSVFASIVKRLKPSSEESVEADEPDGDYVLDLRARNATFTEQGIEKVEGSSELRRELEENLESLYAPEHSYLLPYLDNALRAHAVYQRDKDYIVQDGQVIIVDEFTGRLMHGRRFSEGLHQAIEAKEGVQIRRENLTLATITFQNFFRMYNKLAGMTGTAATESEEFEKIYNLEVSIIPTNLPVIRDDYEDQIFMNERAKFRALIGEVREAQERQQPVLLGTTAIETSERISRMLERENIRHTVLNAKYHEREATIIAQAGQPGTVTIATNMAGRGVDILLGGSPEGVAREILRRQGLEITDATDEQWEQALEEAKAQCERDRQTVLGAGGLYVIGTERHEARRIDNQLRGRSGRQGDPGMSRFFISLEDELMRRFGGERMKGIMDRFDFPDDIPIENSVVSKMIEQSQIRVEGYNFDIRKRVLEYDDVVNRQRETIYTQRQEILESHNLKERILNLIRESLAELVAFYTPDEGQWDLEELHRQALMLYPVPTDITPEGWKTLKADPIKAQLIEGAERVYDEIEQMRGSENMRFLERRVMLGVIDVLWRQNLTNLDVLREGIGLMAYAQRDPLVEYKREAFQMWQQLQGEIRENIVRSIYAEKARQEQMRQQITNIRAYQPNLAQMMRANVQANQNITESAGGNGGAPVPIEADVWDNTGRNDPCPCGSGKKYKHCHWREVQKSRKTRR